MASAASTASSAPLNWADLMARAVNWATGASPARVARATAEAEWALLGLPFDDVMVSADYCQGLGGLEPEAANQPSGPRGC